MSNILYLLIRHFILSFFLCFMRRNCWVDITDLLYSSVPSWLLHCKLLWAIHLMFVYYILLLKLLQEKFCCRQKTLQARGKKGGVCEEFSWRAILGDFSDVPSEHSSLRKVFTKVCMKRSCVASQTDESLSSLWIGNRLLVIAKADWNVLQQEY